MGERVAGLARVLRELRAAAGLTQEELAERSGISARTVSDVERGLRLTVYPHTARKLAAGLGLRGEDGRRFEAVASGRVVPSQHAAIGRPPIPPTPVLGRSEEMARLISALSSPAVRLLTLTGPGGIGKTRLALEVAGRLQSSFPDGVFFVSLGDVHDPDLVAPSIAKVLDVVEAGEGIPVLIERRLAGRQALIVLDTFEHLLPAALLVSSLVVHAPETKFLVTSRRRLNLRGEHEFVVPPLDLPAAADLFMDRAQAAGQDRDLVLEICEKLDGLPLAIELAAARVKHLPLKALAGQLNHQLRLLTGGPLDLPLRQRAIRETIAWSHSLLTEAEREVFRRLSVFSGGWTLAAAEHVCDVHETLAMVSGLVDQSLVVVRDNEDEPRYGMLDVVREYAAEQLQSAGESAWLAGRHVEYFLDVAEQGEANLVGASQDEWSQKLDLERGNLRQAMTFAIAHADAAVSLRFTVALWRYWRHTGEFAEGRRWSEATLAMADEAPASLRAKALWATAFLAFPQGDYERMADLAGEGLDAAREGGDPMDLRNALTVIGQVAMCEGRFDDALEPFRESLEICLRLGSSWQLGTSYLNFGNALLHSGQAMEAERLYREGLGVYRQVGDETFAARMLDTIAHAALAQGDMERASVMGREALIGFGKHRDRTGVAEALDTLAAVAASLGDHKRAARLAGAAAGIHATIAWQPAPFERAITRRFIEASEAAADADVWRSAWLSGQGMSLESAIDYALG